MKTFFPGFPPEGLKFLRRLKQNNNRDWFLEHKEIYEQQVKLPMTGLVLALVFCPKSDVNEHIVPLS